jgi:hypothetical protein
MGNKAEQYRDRPLTSEERAAKSQILEHVRKSDHHAYEAIMRAQRDERQ